MTDRPLPAVPLALYPLELAQATLYSFSLAQVLIRRIDFPVERERELSSIGVHGY